MTNQHPITPPPELVDQWYNECHKQDEPFTLYMTTKAAQWGSDQELEACCEWVECEIGHGREWNAKLRTARRPKKLTLPLTLKDQALALLEIDHGLHAEDLSLLRRALEALPND